MSIPRAAIALFALLAGAGCARSPALRIRSAEEAVARVRKQSECSRALSGEARLTFQGDGRRLAGRVLYLVGAPDRLRFDVISPFGATLSTLTSNGHDFSLFDMREKSFFFGPARTCNVMRFTRLPLPPSALVETLRGRPATIVHHDSELAWVSPFLGSGYYRAIFRAGAGISQELRFGVHPDDYEAPLQKQRLRYLGARVFEAERLSYEVSLSRYRPVSRKPEAPVLDPMDAPCPPSGPLCDAELPGSVRFHARETGYELTIENEELWHNPPLPDSAFIQSAPAGVSLMESRCVD